MATIFEMAEEYVELMELLEDEEISEEEFEEKMSQLQLDTDEKIDGWLRVANELQTKGEAKIAYAKAAEERIKQKKKSGEADVNKSKYMKDVVKNILKLQGKKQFKGKLFNATVKATAPTVEYDDFGEIPDEYKIPQDPKLDTKKLKEYLVGLKKEGKTCEFARLKDNDTLLVK